LSDALEAVAQSDPTAAERYRLPLEREGLRD
jgi:hypothetical protein